MKATEAESAALKQRLKHEPLTPELDAEAGEHTAEAEESVWEVEQGYDTCSPDTYVARELAQRT